MAFDRRWLIPLGEAGLDSATFCKIISKKLHNNNNIHLKNCYRFAVTKSTGGFVNLRLS